MPYTAKELIAALSRMPADEVVYIAKPDHNYRQTDTADAVKRLESVRLLKSDNTVECQHEPFDDDDETLQAWVLF